jgi:hypothetical protein
LDISPINGPKYEKEYDLANLYHVQIGGIYDLIKRRFENQKYYVI